MNNTPNGKWENRLERTLFILGLLFIIIASVSIFQELRKVIPMKAPILFFSCLDWVKWNIILPGISIPGDPLNSGEKVSIERRDGIDLHGGPTFSIAVLE